MATYSPYVLNSSGSLHIIKFSAWFRHSSSDVMVLPDLRYFLFFGEDAGMGAAASAPSTEFSVTSSETSAGTTRFEVDSLGDREGTINFNALKYGHVLVHSSSTPLPLFLLAILCSS